MSASAPLLVSLIAAGAAVTLPVGPRADQVQRRACLHRDGGHAVRHRVVQFPGDPQPLPPSPFSGRAPAPPPNSTLSSTTSMTTIAARTSAGRMPSAARSLLTPSP
jgi:hypothetical protein